MVKWLHCYLTEGAETVADEILSRLDAMEAKMEAGFERLEAKVDEVHKDFHAHQKLTSDNFETVLDTLQAMRTASGGPARAAR